MCHETLIEKLNPNRFPDMSGQMVAIVGCVLGQDWAVPQIKSLWITPDSSVWAMNDGDERYCHFVGKAIDVEGQWKALLADAGLTAEEREEVEQLYRAVVTDFQLENIPRTFYRTVLEYQQHCGDVADSVQQFASDIVTIATEVVACGGGPPELAKHPVCRIWIEHLAQLAGLGGCKDTDAVQEALEACKGRAAAAAQPCHDWQDHWEPWDEEDQQ